MPKGAWSGYVEYLRLMQRARSLLPSGRRHREGRGSIAEASLQIGNEKVGPGTQIAMNPLAVALIPRCLGSTFSGRVPPIWDVPMRRNRDEGSLNGCKQRATLLPRDPPFRPVHPPAPEQNNGEVEALPQLPRPAPH